MEIENENHKKRTNRIENLIFREKIKLIWSKYVKYVSAEYDYLLLQIIIPSSSQGVSVNAYHLIGAANQLYTHPTPVLFHNALYK